MALLPSSLRNLVKVFARSTPGSTDQDVRGLSSRVSTTVAPQPAASPARRNVRQLVPAQAKFQKTYDYAPEGDFQPRLLTHKLQKAERVEQLQDLWDEHHEQFNPIHFSALMQQLAVLHGTVQDSRKTDTQKAAADALLAELLLGRKRKNRKGTAQQQQQQPGDSSAQGRPAAPSAQQLARSIAAAALQPGQCEQLDGRAIVMITHSLAKVGVGDSQLLQNIIQATSPDVMQRLDPQQLTNLVWGVAVCTLETRKPSFASSSSRSESSGNATQHSTGSTQRSSSIDSNNKAGPAQRPRPTARNRSFQVPYIWLASAADALLQQLDRCNSAGLAMALWAFAQLGFKPDDRWWSGFWAATQDKLTGYSGQDLSSVIYAVGKLKAKVPDSWLSSYLSASTNVLPSLSPQQLTMSLWGLATAGCQPDKAWLMLWFLESKAKLHRAATQDLSMWMYSLAVLHITPSPLWCTSFVEASFRRLTAPSTPPQELVNVMWAISCMSWSPPLLFWKGLLNAAAASFHKFNPHDFANCISAATMVDVQSVEKPWFTSFLQASEHKLSGFLPVHLAHTAKALVVILKTCDWAYTCIQASWQTSFIQAAQHQLSQGRFSERNLQCVVDGVTELAFRHTSAEGQEFLREAELTLQHMKSTNTQVAVQPV